MWVLFTRGDLKVLFLTSLLFSLYIYGENFDTEACETLLLNGWRRCGSIFYQMYEKPKHCIPRMVINLVNEFKPSRSQRHVYTGLELHLGA